MDEEKSAEEPNSGGGGLHLPTPDNSSFVLLFVCVFGFFVVRYMSILFSY